ncbi:MAG: MBL fold metallo-hydrolase [Candidatus Latescibacterota bacterium]
MIAIALQSGSNGNALYVESRGVGLLIDAGISGRQARLRLEAAGLDVSRARALLVSHDHHDHVRYAGVYHRQFGLPVHMSQGTYRAARGAARLGSFHQVRHFRVGESLSFGPLTVETVPTPHDGTDGAAFLVDDGRARIGVLTDLGHVFGGLADALASLDGVFLESNYDPEMLENGPYPAPLKQRIRGPGGHLSNPEAAELLRRVSPGRLRWACLAHLSEQNNEPRVALQTHEHLLGGRLPLFVASRYRATGPLEV